MSQHRKRRGYESQRIVADYLKANGWPFAEPAGAGRPGTDVTGIVGVDIEVKARRDLDLNAITRQIQARQVGEAIGVGVVRPDGYGPATVAQWPVVMTLQQAVRLLKGAGF
jgi:hypothetical protein